MPAPPRDTHDVLVSFFATLIAGSALVVSFSQSYFAQRHYKLTTQPSLNFALNGPDTAPRQDQVEGIVLENKGLGPARLTSITYYLDGAPIVAPAGQTEPYVFPLATALRRLESDGVIAHANSMELEPDEFVKENDQIQLIEVRSSDVLKRDIWIAFLGKRIGIEVEYCSIYDICWKRCHNRSAKPKRNEC
jgi:hypothetical protein